jgi:hypothetical protein
MKRKVYTTRRERIIDEILGFLAFPLLNVPLGIVLWLISERIDSQLLAALVSALPWLVNGIVFVLAVLLRPEFAMGYVAFIALTLTVVTALSVLFVAACFVTFVILLSFPGMGDQVAISLFVFLMAAYLAAGLLALGLVAIHVFRNRRSSDENKSH